MIKMLNKKFIFFFISIVNIIEGILGLMLGKVFVRHWHNVNFIESLFWLSSGIIFLYLAFKIKEPKEKITKCPKCKEVFNYNELIDGKCKYCKDVDTIDIEEYFKQYPNELEDKEK